MRSTLYILEATRTMYIYTDINMSVMVRLLQQHPENIETEGKLYGYEKEPKPVTRVRFQKNGDAFIRKETEI